MRYLPAILLGRMSRFAVRLVRPGGGSALPGLILSKLAPGILNGTLRSFPRGLVVVTGSAGKSTTTKMLVAIVRAHGISVFTNPTTANIKQGFYSSILEQSNLFGSLKQHIAILEMDEGHAAELVAEVRPSLVAILNVVEDQLDRFVDPALVRQKLEKVAKSATGLVVLNADDQNMLLIGESVDPKVIRWYGMRDQVAAAKLGYAPTYLPKLPRPNTTTSIMTMAGKSVDLVVHGKHLAFELPARGAHFAVDAAAALESASQILGMDFDAKLAEATLAQLPPVFARGEVVQINGIDVEFILVQNPASTQLNLDNLPAKLDRVMFAIGRDVHDPAWLWTVDPVNLSPVDVVTGYNFAEAELWLRHHGFEPGLATDDLAKAFEYWMALPEPVNGIRTVIFSADSMRRIRRMLGFTSPEEVVR
jgi:UDP-N-acetylmuramyl tripeptide synthase